jgi:tRNA A-37 threonylcarbamoyl transferase component Bud32
MHAAGVWHADLHVKNVLLADGAVVIIDFDRARVLGPVPEPERVGNLLRFDRSVVKLERSGVHVPLRDRLRFFHGYRDGLVDRRAREDVVRRCRKSLARHRRWWSISGTGRK